MYNHSSRILNIKLLALMCDCTIQFVSHLCGNPEDWFSGTVGKLLNVAQITRF